MKMRDGYDETADTPKEPASREEDAALVGVSPKTFGVELADGTVDPVIDRDETIPVIAFRDGYTTSSHNQHSVTIRVVEGEQEFAEDNRLLEEFCLKGIEPALSGEPNIELTFKLGNEGVLEVEAEDIRSGSSERITIEGVMERYLEEEGEMTARLPRLNRELKRPA